MELNDFGKLGVAAALGLLVGLQRERTGPHIAGIRTIALITILGALLGLPPEPLGTWLPPAGLIATALFLITGYRVQFDTNDDEAGLTTMFAALVMFAVGLLVARDQAQAGILVAGGVAVLLHWKAPLHRFADRIAEADVKGVFRLVLFGLVILPLLPNRPLGPLGVLNPFEIWLMVVLICGISVVSYLVYGFVGNRTGTLLCGILGGLISSTATSVSYARRTKRTPEASDGSALVIMIASTAVVARVAVEVGIVAPALLSRLLPPLLVVIAVMVVAAILGALRWGERQPEIELPEDRMELKSALLFGLLYAAVLVGVALAKEHLGDDSLYVVAAVSGLTDVDAITLSTAQMIAKGTLAADTAWRMILTGFLANLVFKTLIVGALADRRAFGRVAAMFGVSLVAGGLVLWLWP